MKKSYSLYCKSALCALLANLAVTEAARADTDDYIINSISPEQIDVFSNGQEYTQIENGIAFLGANYNVFLGAGFSGRIKSFKAWLVLSKNDGGSSFTISFKDYSDGHSWPLGDRPKEYDQDRVISVPMSAVADLFVTQCNVLADRLRSQGLSNQQIFAQNRQVEINAVTEGEASFTGASGTGFVGAQPPETLTINCKKQQGPSIPTAGALINEGPGFGVEHASLTVLENVTLNGACKVVLSGVVRTVGANQPVRFKYRHTDAHSGEQKWSQEYEVTTGLAKTAMFSHEFDVPNKPGTEKGYLILDGQSPEFESNVTAGSSYEMTCNSPAPSGLNAQLPPLLTLQHIAVEHVTVGDRVCPAKLMLHAKIEGRGNFTTHYHFRDGKGASFHGGHSMEIQTGQTLNRIGAYELDWSGNGALPTQLAQGIVEPSQLSQTIKLGFRVFNGNQGSSILAEVPLTEHEILCSSPAISQALPGGANNLVVGQQQAPTVQAQTRKQGATRTASQKTNSVKSAKKADLKPLALKVGNGAARLKAKDAIRKKKGLCRFDLSYQVKNTGAIKSDPKFRNVLVVNGKVAKRHKGVVLKAGQTRNFKARVDLKPGKNEIRLLVDKTKRVSESNENNNKLVKQVQLRGKC